MAAKKRGLGRGLDALLNANTALAEPPESHGEALTAVQNDLREIPIEYLQR